MGYSVLDSKTVRFTPRKETDVGTHLSASPTPTWTPFGDATHESLLIRTRILYDIAASSELITHAPNDDLFSHTRAPFLGKSEISLIFAFFYSRQGRGRSWKWGTINLKRWKWHWREPARPRRRRRRRWTYAPKLSSTIKAAFVHQIPHYSSQQST